PRHHLAAVGDERPQQLGVLVVDLHRGLGAEPAHLPPRRRTARLAAALVVVAIHSIVGIHTSDHGLLLVLVGGGGRGGDVVAGRHLGGIVLVDEVVVVRVAEVVTIRAL